MHRLGCSRRGGCLRFPGPGAGWWSGLPYRRRRCL
jgi:hypothetical protein